MKKIVFILSAAYCVAYIFFDFAKDNDVMKIITAIMTLIFSATLLIYLFNKIDKIFNNK